MRKNMNRVALVLSLSCVVLAIAAETSRAASITWNVAGGGNWDTSTSNWTAPGTYTDGDAVTFNNTAGGVINLTGDRAPLSTTVSAASGTYTFSGANITSGLLAKSGAGTLVLNSQFTSGTMDVTAGTLQWGAAERLPDNVINASYSGGTFDMQNFFETLGGLRGSHNIVNFGGMRLTVGGDRNTGTISGPGALTFDLTSPATIHYFAGTSTYTGGTTIDEGSIRLYNGSNVFPTTGVLTINSLGELYLSHTGGGLTQTIGALNGNGKVLASATNATLSVFNIGNGGGSGIFGGIYSGLGSLTKQGIGTQVLDGNNSYTGTTTVTGGKLIVNGITGPNQGNYTVQANTTLGGSGTINLAGGNAVTVLSGGILEPGNLAPGTLTINGGLNLNNGAILNMELGTGGDTIVVNGLLTGSTGIGGITLNLTQINEAGNFVLLDWTNGSISGLELSDFNLVFGGPGTLSIVGSQLLFTIPVPEPTSFTLLGLGLLALVRKGRRQQKA